MEDPSQPNQAQLCRNGCGFYGSSKHDGMCSICYKDNLQKKHNSGKKSPGLTHSSPSDTSNNSSANGNTIEKDGKLSSSVNASSIAPGGSFSKSPSSVSLPSSSPISIPSATNPNTGLTSSSTQSYSANDLSTSLDSSTSSPSKSKKNRCASCRKRLGLTGFFCRCGNLYCSLHRYSDQHACVFDYRADAQAKIRKENPVVVGEKINKI